MISLIKLQYKHFFASKTPYGLLILNNLLIILLAQLFNFDILLPGILVMSMLILGMLVFGSNFNEQNNSLFLKRIGTTNISKLEYVLAMVFVGTTSIIFIEILTIICCVVWVETGIIPNTIKYTYVDNFLGALNDSLGPSFGLLLDNLFGGNYEEIITILQGEIIPAEEFLAQKLNWLANNSFDVISLGPLTINGENVNSLNQHDEANPIEIRGFSALLGSIWFEFDSNSHISYVHIELSSVASSGLAGLGIVLPEKTIPGILIITGGPLKGYDITIEHTYLIDKILNSKFVLNLPTDPNEVLGYLGMFILDDMLGLYPFETVWSNYSNFAFLSTIYALTVYTSFTLLFAFAISSFFKNVQTYNFICIIYILFVALYGGGVLPANAVDSNFIQFLIFFLPHYYFVQGIHTAMINHSQSGVQNYLSAFVFPTIALIFEAPLIVLVIVRIKWVN